MAKSNRVSASRSVQVPKTVGVSEAHSPAGSKWTATRKYTLFLFVLAYLTYANTLKNGYAYDDLAAISHNVLVRKGISAIPELFSTPYHAGNFKSGLNGKPIDDLYRPLSLVLFTLENSVFGENPFVGHFVNIFLFGACVSMLFLFLVFLFREKNYVVPFLASALFAVHPIHTEVVANVKSVDELLCFFFAFLGLMQFARYVRSDSLKPLMTGLICFFLSLLSKESSITFVAIIPFCFYFYRNDKKQKSLYISVSVFAVAIIYLALRFYVLTSHHAYNPANVPFMQNPLAGASTQFIRYATAILILGKYIKLLFVPYPLFCDYSFRMIDFVSFGDPWVLLSLLAYLCLVVWSAMRLFQKKFDPLTFGLLFYLTTIFIFSNLYFLIGAAMAERFLFFPSVGFCIAIAVLFQRFFFKSADSSLADVLKNRTAVYTFGFIGIVFIGLTIDRNTDWKDDLTLFTTDSDKAPENCRLLDFKAVNQGIDADNSGMSQMERHQKYVEIVSTLRQALSIYPAYGEAATAMSDACFVAGMPDSALKYGQLACNLLPDYPKAILALANVCIAQKKFDLAKPKLMRAMLLAPDNPAFPGDIGTIYMMQKQYDSAVYYYSIAQKLDPGLASSNVYLSVAFLALGKRDSSLKYEAIARRSDPNFRADKMPLPN